MAQPVIQTKYFGELPLEENAQIEFPWGLPGFEQRRRFVAIRVPRTDPLVFLQSLDDPELCFVTLPARDADPGYRLRLSDDDMGRLDLPVSRQPRIGREVQCLVVLAIRDSGTTANLLAPVVINPASMKAVQAVNDSAAYSHQAHLAQMVTPMGSQPC
jgi:flagellar assembly factor FliW